MRFPLAYAEPSDTSGSSGVIVVACAALLVVACGLAFFPVSMAWARRHRKADAIATAAVFWGALAAGMLIHASIAQFQWSKERLLRIETGYSDPQDDSGAPAQPWVAWVALAASYAALIAWSLGQRNPPPTRPRAG